MEGKKVALKVMVAVMIVAMIVAVMPTQAVAYTYNRWEAKNYALSHWNTDVPGSNYFGSDDCTNFVSNCLKAGGWPEVYEPWTYPQHLILRKKPNVWYSNFWTHRYSYTWGGANNFGRFLSIYSGRGYARSLGHKPWYLYFKIGDIVQIDKDKNGMWDHTMIITDIRYDDMYMTYHSTPTQPQESLKAIMDRNKGARFMGYNLKDGYLSADLNCDNEVNIVDYAILMSFWEKDPFGANSRQSPDINQDGKVDLTDFSIMMSQWTG